MKKKLLILLGAGSSVEQDFPTVCDFDKEIATEAQSHADLHNNQNFYDLLWKNRIAYSLEQTAELGQIYKWRTAPSYERVLGDLQLLMNAALEKPFGDPMLQWLVKTGLGIEPQKIFFQINGQLKALLNKVADRIRRRSDGWEQDRKELRLSHVIDAFAPYKKLFADLQIEFDLGVYNLNYDTVALNALPGAFVGFDHKNGDFLATDVLRRQEWNFLYHIHGSAHHHIRDRNRSQSYKDFDPEIIWSKNISQPDEGDWQDVWNAPAKTDQKRVVFSTLVAGGWKLDQLLSEPFATLFSCLPRHLYEADAILIGGYGFGDPHIDALINNMIRSRANSNEQPPIIILDWERNRKAIAKRHDPWASAMATSLSVLRQTFRDPQHRTVTNWIELPETLTSETFEQALNRPVAIWNSGFCSAAAKTAQIVKWLHGESDAL